jgi:cytochrome c oxidase subunit 3
LPDAAAPLAHQFHSLDQQHDVSVLGMWVFLVTELLFFGGLFTTYTIYRYWHPEAFAEASRELFVAAGTANTAILITSSLTMALAVRAAALGRRSAQLLFLALTMALGTMFLGVKAFEYYEEYVGHHVPGLGFEFDGPQAQAAQIFFSLYFGMTGLHALHMIIGIGILAVMFVRALLGHFTAEYYNPLEISGLYWHFVDIVWIFLFPMLYLVSLHTG